LAITPRTPHPGYAARSSRAGGHPFVEHPTLTGDRFLLIAPLWREDDHYRVVLGVYGVGELALLQGTRVHRVLVPRTVTRVEDRVVARGPWREVRYSLQASGELLRLQPEENVDRTFVVEASLPARDGWVRVALASGNWIVALGWALDFHVLTLDGRVLFRGRAPYDEVEFERGPVRLVFWYAWYLLNLSDKDDYQVRMKIASYKWVSEHWGSKPRHFGANVDFVFDPSAQYEEQAFYGPCTLLRLDAKTPVILEFKTPKPGAEAFDYVGEAEDDARGFYSHEYYEKHHWESHYKPDNTLTLLGWLLPLPLLARYRVKSTSPGSRGVLSGPPAAPNPGPVRHELG